MARRRVEDSAPKTSTAERTVDMFPETKAAPPPLGTQSTEQREQTIKSEQDGAIERARERAALEKKLASEETGAITSDDLKRAKELAAEDVDIEREAIKAEGAGSALGAGFFGGKVDPTSKEATEKAFIGSVTNILNGYVPPTPDSGDQGDEVTYTKGEEMYGKPGQFSTYRVGPFSLTTRVRSGETRLDALRRLSKEMETFFVEERDRAKKAFLAHYPTAFQ